MEVRNLMPKSPFFQRLRSITLLRLIFTLATLSLCVATSGCLTSLGVQEEFAAYLKSSSLSEGWPDLCAAAARGHPDAQLIMARAYRNAWKPAKRDDGKAYQWYLRASSNGHPVATSEFKRLKELMAPAMVEVQRQRAYRWEPAPDDCPARVVALNEELTDDGVDP